MLENLSETDVRDFVKNNEKAFVLFSASWCGPCKVMKPMFAKLSTSHVESSFKFAIVDVDTAPNFTTELNIRSVPTIILFNKGIPTERVMESVTASIQKVEKLLNS